MRWIIIHYYIGGENLGSTEKYAKLLENCKTKNDVEDVIRQYEQATKRKAPAWMRQELTKYEN